MEKQITPGIRAAVARNLREFGYPVDDEYVNQKIDSLIAGEKPTDIIGMMAQSQLKQNGYL